MCTQVVLLQDRESLQRRIGQGRKAAQHLTSFDRIFREEISQLKQFVYKLN